MTKYLFLPLLILIACTPVEEQKEDAPGQTQVWEPVTDYNENERVQAICDALKAKESKLNVLVSSAKKFNFNFSQKNCDQDKWPESKLVPTVITESNSKYSFTPVNGEAFGFKEVDTSNSGAMKTICNWGGPVPSPVTVGSRTGIKWTTYTNSSECEAGFGNLCIHLMTGSAKGGNAYAIHTEEYIKFKVMDDNEGFFLTRKLISSAGCKKGKTFEMKATLK